MAASVKKQPKKRMSRAARKEAITGYLYLLPNFIGFFYIYSYSHHFGTFNQFYGLQRFQMEICRD